MKFVLFIPRFIWKMWFLLWMIISTLSFYPILIFTIVVFKNYPLTYKLYRLWGWSICIWNGIFPTIRGKENFPKDSAYVMVGNHTSELDIVVPYTRIKQHFAFLAKDELNKAPLFNINFKGMNVTVDRKSLVSGKNSLIKCNQKLEQNINMLIFPEGTRSNKAPQMRSFKTGPFKLAIEQQVPIVPILYLDNFKRLQGGDFWFGKCGPGRSRIRVLEPISTKGLNTSNTKELMEQVQATMQEALLAQI